MQKPKLPKVFTNGRSNLGFNCVVVLVVGGLKSIKRSEKQRSSRGHIAAKTNFSCFGFLVYFI